MVTIKTRKGTFRVNKEVFVAYMRNLWNYAQARKAAENDIESEESEVEENEGD